MPADACAATATLAPSARALLRARLAETCGMGVLSFAAQVVRQVAHPLGTPAPVELERDVAERLAERLAMACAGDGAAHAATLLAADVALLSACFQNLDLLPAGDAAGDAIALLVLEAMGHLGGG